MTAPLLWSPYSESSALSGVQLESARNEASKLGRLCRGSAWVFWFSFVGPLLVRVVFFPILPFMGVVFFPSFVLGNASGEGGTFLVSLSLFSPLLSLPLLSSPSHSLSFSSFLSPFFFHLILPFSFPFALLFLSLFFFSSFPFLLHKLFPSLFSSSPIFHFFHVSLFLLFLFPPPFSSPEVFFFFEGTACTVCF